MAVAFAAAALCAPAAEARVPQRATLAMDGGTARTIEQCGASQRTAVVQDGARAFAAAALIDHRTSRHGGRHARLVIQRCQDGRWSTVSDERFGTVGRYRRVRSYRLALPTAEHGDFRAQVVVRRDRRRRATSAGPVHFRVGAGEIVDRPVTFAVDNVNRSRAPCEADGKRYTLRGHLMGPRAAVADPKAVTLYLHGVEISDAYFRYRGTPGYDFQTEMAERGHVSVTIDRLGHGESDLPPGAATCVGAQADMAHQVVDQLRAGGYGGGPAFGRVALAGHSFGGFTAEIAQMSFRNADALIDMAFAGEGINGPLLADNQLRGEAGSCNQDGRPKRDGAPTGYAFLWQSTERWRSDTYANTDPRVLEDAPSLRERSPCGELNSAVPTGLVQPAFYREVTVPVLLIFGRQDQVFPPPAGENHRTLYTASPDVTLFEIDNAGHTLMLQRTAEEFRTKLSGWLAAHGY